MSSTFQKPSDFEPVEVSEQKYSRLKWRMLLAAMFCYLFFYTGRQTFGFAIPGLQAELGLNKTTLGAISGAMLWFYALGQMINGNLADKWGGHRLMTAGAVISTILNWCTSFAVGAKTLAVPWAANGFVQAAGWPSGGRVISNWWGSHERGKSFSYYTFAAGMASVLAFITSTLVVDTFHLSWHWIFRIPVLLMLVGGITFYLVARESPKAAGITPPASYTAQDVVDQEPDVDGEDQERSLTRYRLVLRNRKIWSTGIAIGFQNAARYGLLIWVPVHFLGTDWRSGDGGISPLWITVALPFGMAVGALTNGQLSDRFFGSRRDRPIMLFMLAGGICAVTLWVADLGTYGAMVVLFLAGFFVYGPQSSFWALCPDLVGKRMAGTATGVVNCFSYAFAGGAEPLIGHLIDGTKDTSLVFPIVATSCVLSAAAALTIRR